MAKASRSGVSIYMYAKIAAVAVVSILAFGLLVFLTETRTQNTEDPITEPMSFLQVSEKVSEKVHFLGRREQCPPELLAQYADCTVVPFRAGFHLGPHGFHPPSGSFSVMASRNLVSSSLPRGSRAIIGWKPVIEKTRSTCPGKESEMVELVHHINAYIYKGRKLPADKFFAEDTPEGDKALDDLNGNADGDTATMVANYDRNAGSYILPTGYGISASDPISLQYHFLFPECWDHQKQINPENSGMDLYMTSKTPHPAALIGALNFNSVVHPKQGKVEVVTQMDPDRVQKLLSLRPDGKPEILAAHLHTHDLTQSKFFQVKNPDGSVLFRSEKEATGYSPGMQSFQNIADKGWPALVLKPGMRIEQHCQFDSDHLDHSVPYGLDWGQEMCAPLLLVGGAETTATLVSGEQTRLVLLGKMGRLLKQFFSDVATDVARLTLGS